MNKYLERGVVAAFILFILWVVGCLTAIMYFTFGMVGTWIMFTIVLMFYFWAAIRFFKSKRILEETINNMSASNGLKEEEKLLDYKQDAKQKGWVLNFCPKCNQMTNHEKAGQCLKCKSKRDAKQKQKEINSQQEKCGDTLTHQHRHGTHPEEGQASKENDMATVDTNLSESKEVKNEL